MITNIGVIVLRRTRPDLERGFRVPFVPVFPLIGVAAGRLPDEVPRAPTTWGRFAVWLAVGLIIYFLYGIQHSRLRQGVVENPEAMLD